MSNASNANVLPYGWKPYRPDEYPIRDADHNPWVPIDPISGATAYDVWQAHGKPADADTLRAALAELVEKR